MTLMSFLDFVFLFSLLFPLLSSQGWDRIIRQSKREEIKLDPVTMCLTSSRQKAHVGFSYPGISFVVKRMLWCGTSTAGGRTRLGVENRSVEMSELGRGYPACDSKWETSAKPHFPALRWCFHDIHVQ